MEVMSFIIGVWIFGAILTFILLLSKNNIIKYTNLKTNETYYLKGIKKFLIILLFSIIWFYFIIKSMFNKEGR